MDDLIRQKVNRICALKLRADELNKEIKQLEGFFFVAAEKDLEDTKIKTRNYFGDNGNSVSVTMAASVKMEHPTMLKKALGKQYDKLVKTKPSYTFSDPAKRMLAGLFLDNYTRTAREDVIKQIGVDSKTEKVILKKVKGINFKNDVKALQAIGKLSIKDAQYYAYFISEATVWDSFIKTMQAEGVVAPADMAARITEIKNAVIVEETPKITVEIISEE